jgi:hypothetical protein
LLLGTCGHCISSLLHMGPRLRPDPMGHLHRSTQPTLGGRPPLLCLPGPNSPEQPQLTCPCLTCSLSPAGRVAGRRRDQGLF